MPRSYTLANRTTSPCGSISPSVRGPDRVRDGGRGHTVRELFVQTWRYEGMADRRGCRVRLGLEPRAGRDDERRRAADGMSTHGLRPPAIRGRRAHGLRTCRAGVR